MGIIHVCDKCSKPLTISHTWRLRIPNSNEYGGPIRNTSTEDIREWELCRFCAAKIIPIIDKWIKESS